MARKAEAQDGRRKLAHTQRPGVLQKEASSRPRLPTPSQWLLSKPQVNLFLEGKEGQAPGPETPPAPLLLVRWTRS